MTQVPEDPATEAPRPSHLRLAWSNPRPPVPRAPVDFALAIERHLSGQDGLTDEQFLQVYARRRGAAPAWSAAAAIV